MGRKSEREERGKKTYTDHQSETPDLSNRLSDLRVRLEVVQHLEDLLTPLLNVRKDTLVRKRVLDGNTGSASNCVSTVCSTLRAGGLLVHELLAGDDGGEGETVGDTLGHDHDVGNDGGPVLDGAEGGSGIRFRVKKGRKRETKTHKYFPVRPKPV